MIFAKRPTVSPLRQAPECLIFGAAWTQARGLGPYKECHGLRGHAGECHGRRSTQRDTLLQRDTLKKDCHAVSTVYFVLHLCALYQNGASITYWFSDIALYKMIMVHDLAREAPVPYVYVHVVIPEAFAVHRDIPSS